MLLYKSILLVDDDPEDREIFMESVASIDRSVECIFAADGEKALQLLNNDILNKPDMIFLDLNMPFLNGKQTLGRLKSTKGLEKIPVIMYSTFFNEQDIAEIQKLGASYCLLKPTEFGVLIASLKSILEKKW